jgi:hypothetical protein
VYLSLLGIGQPLGLIDYDPRSYWSGLVRGLKPNQTKPTSSLGTIAVMSGLSSPIQRPTNVQCVFLSRTRTHCPSICQHQINFSCASSWLCPCARSLVRLEGPRTMSPSSLHPGDARSTCFTSSSTARRPIRSHCLQEPDSQRFHRRNPSWHQLRLVAADGHGNSQIICCDHNRRIGSKSYRQGGSQTIILNHRHHD